MQRVIFNPALTTKRLEEPLRLTPRNFVLFLRKKSRVAAAPSGRCAQSLNLLPR